MHIYKRPIASTSFTFWLPSSLNSLDLQTQLLRKNTIKHIKRTSYMPHSLVTNTMSSYSLITHSLAATPRLLPFAYFICVKSYRFKYEEGWLFCFSWYFVSLYELFRSSSRVFCMMHMHFCVASLFCYFLKRICQILSIISKL